MGGLPAHVLALLRRRVSRDLDTIVLAANRPRQDTDTDQPADVAVHFRRADTASAVIALADTTPTAPIRYEQVIQADPLFPRTVLGRLQLAAESSLLLGCGIYAVFDWPPVGIVARGLWVDVFFAIVFELMVATIPLAFLGLWWAVATPEWIRTLYKRAFHHLGIVVFALVITGLLGMIAGALGWW